MTKKKKPVHLRRWAVVVPAIGVVITGAALWYNYILGEDAEPTNAVEINQTASDGVNVGGDNNGFINTGDFNGGDQ